MALLTPLALLLAAAAAVPILLHLFQRHQGPRVVFPALRYLRRAEKESARRIRLRQLLLLLLRVSAIVLIAFVAARPFLRHGGGAHVPTAAVLVLDNSASTSAVVGERRIIDELKERAIESLMAAGPDDRFWLLRAGAPWEPALPGDAHTLADRVRETEPTSAAADLGASVERARGILAAGAEGRAQEIQLLSDLQRTNLRAVRDAADDVPLIVWMQDIELAPNIGVADVELGGGLEPRAGERSNIAVTLVGSGQDSTQVRVISEGRTIAAGIGASGSTIVLTTPARNAGLFLGYAEIDPDALRADNRRYFVGRVAPVPTVALTTPVPFVDDALAVMADARRIQRTDPGSASIIIAPGGAGLGTPGTNRTLVITAPNTPLELPAVNRRLTTLGIPWQFEAATGAGAARFAIRDSTDVLERQLAGVQLRSVYPLRPTSRNPADSVMLRLADGTAWAVRGNRAGGGRFILLGSPLSGEASTLPTSPAMLPLLDRVTGAWAASAPSRSSYAPGEIVQIAEGARAVKTPEGQMDSITAGDVYRAGAQAGIYEIHGDTGLIDAFAVNTAPAESNLARADTRALHSAFQGWDIETADSPREWSSDVFQHRLGRELWWPLILAVLLILLCESLLATSGAGARRARTTTAAGPTGEPPPMARTEA